MPIVSPQGVTLTAQDTSKTRVSLALRLKYQDINQEPTRCFAFHQKHEVRLDWMDQRKQLFPNNPLTQVMRLDQLLSGLSRNPRSSWSVMHCQRR